MINFPNDCGVNLSCNSEDLITPGIGLGGGNSDVSFFTDRDSHSHGVDIGQFNSGNSGSHQHDLDLSATNSDVKNHEPPWFGLVKIIRIK